MARFIQNNLTFGMTGKIGKDICLRQLNGKTIACSRPRKRPGPGTPAQEKSRQKMKEATAYASRVLTDEATAKLYHQKVTGKLSAQNLAVMDFMKKPRIIDLEIRSYNGRPGDEINVQALDDFMLTEVQVSIYNSDNILVEEGRAVLLSNGITWQYTPTMENFPVKGSRIIATAFDLPGNAGCLEALV